MRKFKRDLKLAGVLLLSIPVVPACTTTNNNYYSDGSEGNTDVFPDPLYLDQVCKDAGYEPEITISEDKAPPPVQASYSKKEMKTLLSNEAYSLLDYINQERAKRKLSKLQMALPLNCASQKHADDIGVRKACTHTGEDGSNFVKRVKNCGYQYASGEIVACGQKTAKAAVDAWIKSPGHLSIMVDPSQKYFGAGWKNNYWVVVFSKN